MRAGTATNVSGVYLSNNSIYGAFNAGVLINVADSVTIVGGQISGNGLNPSSAAVGAGVAIIGAATNVTIDGVNMSAYNPFLGTNPASQQAYALAVSGSGSASVSNCNMQNNANGALYQSSPGSLSIVNCKGYNTVSLLSSSVPTSTVFTPLVSLGAGWFGPATLYVSGGTVSSVAIGAGSPGVSAATTSGSFQLPATTGFVLTYSMAPTITVLTQ